MPGLRFASGPRRRVFSPPSDVTPGEQPASRFTWRTTDGSSTPNRWPETSLRERPNFATGQRMLLPWRGRATHVSARSLILSTLITGLDGRSNFEQTAVHWLPPPPCPSPAATAKPAGDPNPGSSQKETACGSDGIKSGLVTISALARPLSVSDILGTMREILPGIFTWGSTYADRPWEDLRGRPRTQVFCDTARPPGNPRQLGVSSLSHVWASACGSSATSRVL
jgi:hypothetical protein